MSKLSKFFLIVALTFYTGIIYAFVTLDIGLAVLTIFGFFINIGFSRYFADSDRKDIGI